eukprot:scaffold161880_cov28-Tisochrysis_lutea.AAC.2
MFTIAAAFGNVHGVYKAGNVKLRPELLGDFQVQPDVIPPLHAFFKSARELHAPLHAWVPHTPAPPPAAQKHLAEKLGQPADSKPFFFVFHGGSGSEKKDIESALGNGVVRYILLPRDFWAPPVLPRRLLSVRPMTPPPYLEQVKMNVDTDTQWAYWKGILEFYQKNEDKLQGQIGNNDGPDKPNKSYYDPRKWVREAEVSMIERVQESCADLKNVN